MNAQEFWFQKILQFLHDPPGKPYAFWPKSGGHAKLAGRIFEEILGERLKPSRVPDLLATGADRPLITVPRGQKGGLGTQYFHIDPTVTHPLAHAPLRLPLPKEVEKVKRDNIDELAEIQVQAASVMQLTDKNDADDLHRVYLNLWRRFREEIIKQDPGSLWEFMPADSRCPDHSIWEHNRLASALAFVKKNVGKMQPEDPSYPWLFSLALQPVQEFLKQARKSQDLWVGSMLVAELSWAALEPVIEHYGPDAIVYPDLRGNPRADIWLNEKHKEALPNDTSNQLCTRAGVIPHTYVALLPYGNSDSGSHLRPIKDLAGEACENVQKKWTTLSNDVKEWMEKIETVQSSERSTIWSDLWDHGIKQCPLKPTWVASPWPAMEKQQRYYFPGGALLAQDKDKIEKPVEADAKVIHKRMELLGGWLPENIWDRYEYILSVYGRTNDTFLLSSGFSYAAAHHKLKVRHALRRRHGKLPVPSPTEGSYQKCTLCRTRGALGKYTVQSGDWCEHIRTEGKKFWKHRELDPEEKGQEQLCSVCAVRRFLVRSESRQFTDILFGSRQSVENARDSDKRLRTPFPSTVVIATQEYLEHLAVNYEDYKDILEQFVTLYNKLKLEKSTFPSALPRLLRAVNAEPRIKQFLQLDPQLSLFPEMLESKHQSAKEEKNYQQETWNKIKETGKELRKRADEKNKFPPQTQIAVLVMDGDEMGKLLLGDPKKIKARWKDIIHSTVGKKMLETEYFQNTGWPELLNLPRTSGPSLQAFISRALAYFSHHIVPWVIEQEFFGRLIYTGGDDLLALLPAREALRAASRLQELFSAPWVIDSRPDLKPWSWLTEKDKDLQQVKEAGNRFKILAPDASPTRHDGRLFPMLGESGSLSAGIMYGHFKTRMGLLLEQARFMLDQVAKDKVGRSGAGLGHFSRSGLKTGFGAHWHLSKSSTLKDAVDIVVDAFEKSKIPASLPYKLVEYCNWFDPYVVEPAEDRAEIRQKLMQGLLAKALGESTVENKTVECLMALWEAGMKLSHNTQQAGYCLSSEQNSQNALDGIFLCRYLASRTEES